MKASEREQEDNMFEHKIFFADLRLIRVFALDFHLLDCEAVCSLILITKSVFIDGIILAFHFILTIYFL